MTTVRSCDFSKERAKEHNLAYCEYNENGKCTLTEIKLITSTTEWGAEAACGNSSMSFLGYEEEQPIPPYGQRVGFGILERLRERRLLR